VDIFTAPPALSRAAFCALEYRSVATLFASWAYRTAGPPVAKASVTKFQTIAALLTFAETLETTPRPCETSAPVDVGFEDSTPFEYEKLFK
jgi:hypothetical protein